MSFASLPKVHFPPSAFGVPVRDRLRNGMGLRLSEAPWMKSRPSTVTAHGTERRKVPVRKGESIPSEISREMGEKRIMHVIQYFAPHRPRWSPFTEDEGPGAAFLAGPYMVLSTHCSHIRVKDSSWFP